MKVIFRAGLIAAALAASSIACAEGYVVGSIGRSTVDANKAALDSVLTGAGATALSSTLNNTDTGYKIQIGQQLSPNWAVEGGWVNFGKVNYSATFTGGNASVDAKASGFNVAALGILPLNESFSLFGKLGVIYATVDASASIVGRTASGWATASASNWKPTWGLGGTINVSKQVGIRAEFEQFSKLGDTNTGKSTVDLLSVGMVFKF
jgi:OOP family OmpA-OmpF porin